MANTVPDDDRLLGLGMFTHLAVLQAVNGGTEADQAFLRELASRLRRAMGDNDAVEEMFRRWMEEGLFQNPLL